MSSRYLAARRDLARSLAAIGRKIRLADPTPYTVAINATAIPAPKRLGSDRCSIT